MTVREPDRDLQPFWMDIRGRHIFTLVVLVALALLLYEAREHLVPYIFGFTMAYFLLPVVRVIESWLPTRGRMANLRRPIATVLSMLLAVGFVIVLISLLAQPINEEMQELADSFPEYWTDLTEDGTFGDWYIENVPPDVQVWLNENVGTLGQALLNAVTGLLESIVSITGNVFDAIAAMSIVPIFMVYVLIERSSAGKLLRSLLPEAWVDDAIQVLRLSDRIMGSYTRGVISSSFIVGIITGFGYWLIGVDLWLALAVIAFLGEIVPIIGPWIAFFISFPVILVTQPEKAILAMVVFGVIQLLEGWFISPKIQGESIELPSSLVLLSLAIGGAVAGAIGIVLALPAAAILRVLTVYTMRRLDRVRPIEASVGLLPTSRKKAHVDQPEPIISN